MADKVNKWRLTQTPYSFRAEFGDSLLSGCFVTKGRLGCNRSLCHGIAAINIKSRHDCEANTEAACTTLANKIESEKICSA